MTVRSGVQRKSPNNTCRVELGRYPIIIKILNLKFYNHLKESDSNTLHNKALTPRVTSRRDPYVLGPCPQHNNHRISQNQIIGKQK